jgi:Na+-driven multidrug efflux pump
VPTTRTRSSPRPYWGLSIPSLLFLPVGLVALYFSVQVGQRLLRGDEAGARKASRYALVWGIVGVALVAVLLLASLGS